MSDNSGAQPKVLFSAVGTNSIYAPFVPSGKLLPCDITLTEEHKYKKNIIDIYVLCAVHESAKNFGFIKWNTHFIKLYCIPFAVNSCPDKGPNQVASGRLAIYYGTKTGDVVSKGNLITSFNFPGANNTTAEFCFPDNYDIPNDDEYYYFELYTNYKGVENPLPVSAGANVTTLLDYKKSNAWDVLNKVLHLDLCDCKNWFFPCQEYELGTYVFEDLWPNEGDYDFNDLIIEYHISKKYCPNYLNQGIRKVKAIEMDFDLKTLGAGYTGNAFAIRFNGMEYNNNYITVLRLCDDRSGSGYQPYWLVTDKWGPLDPQSIQYTPDGVVVVPVIENTEQKFLITHPSNKSQINTIQDDTGKRGKGFKYRLIVQFENPINDNFTKSPILLPMGERQREINMPLIKPTALCDYLGYTGIDPNNPPAYYYFYTSGPDHLPWIMDVPYLNIRYAQEFERVDVVYAPEFQQWCNTLYTSEPTWWWKTLDPNINFFYNRALYPDIE